MSAHRGQTAIVTGGAAGIGRAAALLLAERGARVAVLDVDGLGAAQVAEEARGRGAPAAVGLRCDVSVEAEVAGAFAAVEEQLGVPTWLFANAGIGAGGGMLHELDLDLWQRVIAINLGGIYLCCKYALRAMVAAGRGGAIVCTSSPTAFGGQAAGGVPAYSAAKGGVSALVRCLAVDYARYGIRVNAIVPGATETALMWDNVPPEDIAGMRQTIHGEVPLGRLGDPDEPARAAVWLLSDEASYVTGSHLVCDGGILAKLSISV